MAKQRDNQPEPMVQKSCVICGTLTLGWGRTRFDEYLCSLKCNTIYYNKQHKPPEEKGE